MLNLLKSFWTDEEGAAAIEYALIAALIAIAFVVGATLLGDNLQLFFNSLGTYLGVLETKVPSAP